MACQARADGLAGASRFAKPELASEDTGTTETTGIAPGMCFARARNGCALRTTRSADPVPAVPAVSVVPAVPALPVLPSLPALPALPAPAKIAKRALARQRGNVLQSRRFKKTALMTIN